MQIFEYKFYERKNCEMFIHSHDLNNEFTKKFVFAQITNLIAGTICVGKVTDARTLQHGVQIGPNGTHS